MHISEGVLSPAVLGGGAALTAVGTAIGLKKLDYEAIPRVALLSAAVCVASLIHVPVGPVGLHLVLNGLMGLLLGWLAFPAILIALFLQALLFQFGGLTVLGVNTFTMATPRGHRHFAERLAGGRGPPHHRAGLSRSGRTGDPGPHSGDDHRGDHNLVCLFVSPESPPGNVGGRICLNMDHQDKSCPSLGFWGS
ncbi:MAG: cobalt transporter CbiM [Syntrophobacterales bacterium]